MARLWSVLVTVVVCACSHAQQRQISHGTAARVALHYVLTRLGPDGVPQELPDVRIGVDGRKYVAGTFKVEYVVLGVRMDGSQYVVDVGPTPNVRVLGALFHLWVDKTSGVVSGCLVER